MKKEKQNKNRWAITSGNGHKNPWDPSEKWGRQWWKGFMEKG